MSVVHLNFARGRVRTLACSIALAVGAVGCGGIVTLHLAPQVTQPSDVRPSDAYVYGRFYLEPGSPLWLSLELENTETHEPIDIELVSQGYSVRAVRVPPGRYRIAETVMRRARTTRGLLPHAVSRAPFPFSFPGVERDWRRQGRSAEDTAPTFSVAAGELVYIGDFHGLTRTVFDGWEGGVDAFVSRATETTEQLFASFSFLRARRPRVAFENDETAR